VALKSFFKDDLHQKDPDELIKFLPSLAIESFNQEHEICDRYREHLVIMDRIYSDAKKGLFLDKSIKRVNSYLIGRYRISRLTACDLAHSLDYTSGEDVDHIWPYPQSRNCLGDLKINPMVNQNIFHKKMTPDIIESLISRIENDNPRKRQQGNHSNPMGPRDGSNWTGD
jgi:hypothetical protein